MISKLHRQARCLLRLVENLLETERPPEVTVGNLVSNALKFSAPGTAVRLRASPAEDGGVTIEVSNLGLPCRQISGSGSSRRSCRGTIPGPGATAASAGGCTWSVAW